MDKNTWIVLAFVAFVFIGDLLSRKAFGLFCLGITIAFFIFLAVFHFLDSKGKMN